jgi:hypothetical protein
MFISIEMFWDSDFVQSLSLTSLKLAGEDDSGVIIRGLVDVTH